MYSTLCKFWSNIQQKSITTIHLPMFFAVKCVNDTQWWQNRIFFMFLYLFIMLIIKWTLQLPDTKKCLDSLGKFVGRINFFMQKHYLFNLFV